jgi:hypothetical protein
VRDQYRALSVPAQRVIVWTDDGHQLADVAVTEYRQRKHVGVADRARRGGVPAGQVVPVVGEKLGEPTTHANDVDADIGILVSPPI